MKAIIRKGKHKGLEVEISQWCNDWFTIEHPDIEPKYSVKSPDALLFTPAGWEQIKTHKNNGILFNLYEPCTRTKDAIGVYFISFRKRK